MAFSNQVYGIVSQALDEAYTRQDAKREKANTLVVAAGTVVAALLAALTYVLEANVDGLPSWLPVLVPVLTMVGTMLGVSKTKNGITPSILEQVNGIIADMIDRQQRDGGHAGVPEPVPPVVVEDEVPTTPAAPAAGAGVDDIAAQLEAIAKRLGRR